MAMRDWRLQHAPETLEGKSEEQVGREMAMVHLLAESRRTAAAQAWMRSPQSPQAKRRAAEGGADERAAAAGERGHDLGDTGHSDKPVGGAAPSRRGRKVMEGQMSLDLLFEPSDAAPVFEPAPLAPPERAAHAASPEKGTAATEPSRRPIGDASPAPSRTRIARNIEAVMVAKELEREGREATPEEAARMLSFVGWGGLAEVFDETLGRLRGRAREAQGRPHGEGVRQGARVHAHRLLHPDRGGPRGVGLPLAMAGFSAGNVLDPAAGTGRFADAMPEGMAGLASITMVEPDPVSALIAQHAHPGMAVQCKGLRGDDAGRRLVLTSPSPTSPSASSRSTTAAMPARDARPRLLLRQVARPRAPGGPSRSSPPRERLIRSRAPRGASWRPGPSWSARRGCPTARSGRRRGRP